MRNQCNQLFHILPSRKTLIGHIRSDKTWGQICICQFLYTNSAISWSPFLYLILYKFDQIHTRYDSGFIVLSLWTYIL